MNHLHSAARMDLSFLHRWAAILLAFSLLFFAGCNKKRSGKPKILVFSKTAGYFHASIPAGVAALQKLGAEQNMEVDTTTNSDYFSEDSLKKYSAVIFLNTTLNVLNHQQEVAFERYIQSGGGFVGIHAATDTEYDWGWYNRLVGANFASHPQIQEAVLRVKDKNNPAVSHLPSPWKKTDEWYNFKKINKEVNVILTLDESSYQGGTNGKDHPVAWYHEYDGGRAFYTALGHTEESYTDPLFLKHVLGGIQYAIGENKELDYSKAKTPYPPDEDRFVKTTLTQGTLFEPTEMAVLPNLDVLIAQRRGELMRYSERDKTIKQVGFLNVYHKTELPDVNAEEGLMGIAADPDFKNNHFIYLFYSPADTSVNRLSRFVFKNDTLDLKSEKVVLQFYSQRNICCHTGGSIAFGKDNLLYLSTGDNSTPFDEKGQTYVNHGYAPLDARPGHEQYDARRTSGNTNDLRGKIIRIRIKPDGSYEIPEGNLFPKSDKARPEIYVMGNRNPYRISVDRKKGFLYWGEVGPDAREDSLDTRGPRGYDEVNQARQAGFFGWPLFVGDNYAYHEYDYGTGKSGPLFDPKKPVNTSRNNTGLQELPPAQPAFIWYPYADTKDFPQVGSGGRNAMAGPAYYTEDYPKETRLPDYYNGKVFIYDWMRGWIKAVSTLPNGDFDKMEPFMENTRLSAPIDIEAGPDGRLYILEYGSGWFTQNPDAGLSRIDYLAGNRPPKVSALTIEKKGGALPFTFTAKVEAKDPEGDELTYIWTVGKETIKTKEPQLTHTLSKAGDYAVSVEVQDEENAIGRSNSVEVFAGNEEPEVAIQLLGNKSFYFPGKEVAYKVGVQDKGDSINKANLFVSVDYVQGFDLAEKSMGHQVVSGTIMGKNLMMASDCKGCHKVAEPSIGPSFTQVAQRYAKDRDANAALTQKIIKGSAGVWGENAMPAHPNMKEADARLIVQWIRSLAKEGGQKSLPMEGKVLPQPKKDNSVFTLQVSYTDNGAMGVRPLSATNAVFLRSSILDAAELTSFSGFTIKDSTGSKYLVYPSAKGWIKLAQVDLSGIKQVEFTSVGTGAVYNVEVRSGSAEGRKIGEGKLDKGKTTITIQPVSGGLQDVYFVVSSSRSVGSGKPLLKTIRMIP